MNYKRFFPPAAIRPFVLFFWEFEGDFSAAAPYSHAVSASVHSKLAFQFKGQMRSGHTGRQEPLFKSGFQCQNKACYQISAQHSVGIFGVYLQPLAVPLLFNIPAETLTDYNVEVSDLLGPGGRELEEKIMLCTNAAERIDTISRFIAQRISDVPHGHRGVAAAVQQIISMQGLADIGALTRQQFISQRQFERRFKTLTGFSPKMFSRIVRFEACIAKAAAASSLTSLSVASGYYDQSHMIRDFIEFSGGSPKAYFAEDHTLLLG
ncbi:hypothetical protein C7T94_05280 [Pedobacter yulinensis]|uniref:HTH araC/xylS-type domain-containing protein n=1 Tax=Pedobacter yulinensis TaxID=2126353 RepID=A0A2T3HNX7_9SPHI|nr:helix-turn-helix domain-containing protein [Pedobacter yulinensis]PST84142.1 hypothetical protein C7T94_05280 [Pedobacter yulinensis]